MAHQKTANGAAQNVSRGFGRDGENRTIERALQNPVLEASERKGPDHTKNTTVIVIHYGGSKTLRQ